MHRLGAFLNHHQVKSVPHSPCWLLSVATLLVCLCVLTRCDTNDTPPSAAPPSGHDTLCNRRTEHQCVCQSLDGSLHNQFLPCRRFIEAEELPMVVMTLRHVNLSARLYTNETYESYFKRRIAHSVSTFCEQQANDCPGITLRLNKENVIVLSVATSGNSTSIGFVVTKAPHVGSLNDVMVMDARQVRRILSAQLAPLSRVLGGIRIEHIDVASLKRRDVDSQVAVGDNTKLLVLLAVTGLFLLITYLIATVKVCRECHQRKRAKRTEAALAVQNQMPDYGSCGGPNVAVTGCKSSTADQNPVIHNTTRKVIDNSRKPSTTLSIESQSQKQNLGNNLIDERHFHLMFQCDPSQLPDEQLSFSHSFTHSSSVELETKQNTSINEQKASINEPHTTKTVPPALVIAQAVSCDDGRSMEHHYTVNNNDNDLYTSLNQMDDPEYPKNQQQAPERPVSRRGSYSRDDVLDQIVSPAPPLAAAATALVVEKGLVQRSRTAHKFDHWSSDSEEEGQTQGYHKLSEQEEEEEEEDEDREPDTRPEQDTTGDRKVTETGHRKVSRPEQDTGVAAGSDMTDELTDAQVYERLDDDSTSPSSSVTHSPASSPIRDSKHSPSPFVV